MPSHVMAVGDLSAFVGTCFSLISVLSHISALLADAKIGVFAISACDTDYVLTHAADFERAPDVLRNAGYDIA